MRMAFVVADVRSLRPSYATSYLGRAASARGHDVGFVGVNDLTLTASDEVAGRVIRPQGAPATPDALCAALAARDAVARQETLSGYDVVFLRYHPSRERVCAGNPAIDFGWRLRLGGVAVINDPEGIRRAGGRMYLSELPAEIRPRTLISREPAKLKAFLRALDAPAVVKPLAEPSTGGENVFYVARGQVKNLNQILAVVRQTGYVMAQEYLPDAAHGEKRLLLLGGEPVRMGKRVAIYRRVRSGAPSAGGPPDPSTDVGTRKRCDLGAAEQRIVDLLAPKLVADGLYFVAVDIVGGKVLEVNVFTPGGIHSNLELYGVDVSEAVIRDLERRVEVRKAYRKTLERVA